jgi:hypothetical protein
MTGLLGDRYQVDAVPFTTGDRLLLYTDGVSETRDHTGTFYPLAHRVRRWTSAPPRQLLDHLHQDLRAYVAGTRDDDLAALVAHRVAPEDREPRTQLDRAVRIGRIDHQSARSGGGAAGSPLKEAGAQELLGAASRVAAGATYVQPAMGARLDVADHGTAGAESADGSDTVPAVRNTPRRKGDGRGGQP